MSHRTRIQTLNNSLKYVKPLCGSKCSLANCTKQKKYGRYRQVAPVEKPSRAGYNRGCPAYIENRVYSEDGKSLKGNGVVKTSGMKSSSLDEDE